MTSAPESFAPEADEELVAAALLDACAVLAHRGLVEAFGHVSARLGDDRFLITPGAALKYVTREDLVVLDGRGNRVRGGDDPPLEAPLHLSIYAKRPDVGAIARTHPHVLSVFAVAGVPVTPVHDLGAVVPTPPPLFDDTRLVANFEIGEEAASALGAHSALLLRGNGALTVGDDIRAAVIRNVYLDETARILFDAYRLGTPRPLEPDAAAAMGELLMQPRHVARSWQFLLREAGRAG